MVQLRQKRRRAGNHAVEAGDRDVEMPEDMPDLGGVGEAEEPAQKKWKSVQLNLELMKEFESAGGLFMEECGDDDIGVTYGDGRTEVLSQEKKASKKSGKQVTDVADDAADDAEVRNAKKKKKSKSKEKPTATAPEDLSAENERLRRELAELKREKEEAQEVEVVKPLPHWIQFDLHPALLRGISRLGFEKPTEVQRRCLDPAIRQRKDIVGAAETGSGKTLAFGLPILHHTLHELYQDGGSAGSSGPRELRALSILPTRELAVQVQKHINAVAAGTGMKTECIVGGMSSLKQQRLLRKCPQIVVGTPGRIFAMLGLGKDADTERCDWLRDSTRGLRHLVLDEADRLVEAGHFRELDRILAHIYGSLERPQQLQTFVFSATLTLDPRMPWRMKDKSLKKKKGADQEECGKVEQLMNRLQFREARAVHIVDLTQGDGGVSSKAALPLTAAEAAKQERGGVIRQLPERLDFWEAVASDEKDREAMLAMWLLRRFRWEEALKQDGKSANTGQGGGSSGGGRIVIFVNAITMVMRLAPILALMLESPAADQVLAKVRMKQEKGKEEKIPGPKVEVIGLHSKMRQKERLKKMERFRSCKDALLVCTDIAARGLDVPEVAAVLHYQAPRGVEIFVHRSGRTARAGRSGDSVAFVAPKDTADWGALYKGAGLNKADLNDVKPTAFEVAAAKEAIHLSGELEGKVHKMAKEHQERCWFQKNAEEAELMLDDDDADKDAAKQAEPRKLLWGLYRQLVARVRRPPKRFGGGPLPRRLRGEASKAPRNML